MADINAITTCDRSDHEHASLELARACAAVQRLDRGGLDYGRDGYGFYAPLPEGRTGLGGDYVRLDDVLAVLAKAV